MRTQKDYRRLSRSQVLNHLRTEWTKVKPEHRLSQFLQKYVWVWVYHSLKSRFGAKYRYPVYSGKDKGIYEIAATGGLAAETTIGITADWATDTPQSFDVMKAMSRQHPDYTIHLGDTYYAGTPDEIRRNFLGPGSPWLRGTKGSFAVLGNHEMYARGISFFRDLLPKLGQKLPELGLRENDHFHGQQAGYFCLQNEHWRILALDTGYNSIGFPILELIPSLSPNCHFESSLIAWLRDTVRLDNPDDHRSLVILTHHQFITAFKNEAEHPVPAKQLADAIGHPCRILWIWGHEHKFAMYERVPIDDNVMVYGRCIGHGGMPIEISSREFMLSARTKGRDKLVMVDRRRDDIRGQETLGHNGYAILRLSGATLTVEYYDIHRKLVQETWTAGPGGIGDGTITVEPGSGLETEEGKGWGDLVSL
jgi:Calcineurin-like phosphoesterase